MCFIVYWIESRKRNECKFRKYLYLVVSFMSFVLYIDASKELLKVYIYYIYLLNASCNITVWPLNISRYFSLLYSTLYTEKWLMTWAIFNLTMTRHTESIYESLSVTKKKKKKILFQVSIISGRYNETVYTEIRKVPEG